MKKLFNILQISIFNARLYALSVTVCLLFLQLNEIKAQCSTGCSTVITSSGGSGNLDLAAGDTVCINATGGDINVNYTRIAMRPGTGLKMCTDASSTIVMNSELRFFSGGVGTEGEIINNGNFQYSHGSALSVSRTKWTNFGSMIFDDNLIIGSASSLINESSGTIDITGDLEVTSGSITASNNGLIGASGDVTISSPGVALNGVIEAGGKLTLNSSATVDLTNSIFIADELELNGGTYNIDPSGCAAFLITNVTTIFSGISVVGGGEIDITDSTASSTGDVNNCSTCSGLNFVATNTCATVLPVNFLVFYAKKEENNVTLNWKTASELNNDHFVVERSTDGFRFTTIGVVDGNGTTQEMTSYRFVDQDNPEQLAYYRLKQYDHDGGWEYSDVIVYNPFSSNASILDLRSFGDFLQAEWSTKHEIVNYSVLDVSGNQIATNNVEKNDIIDVSHLKKGIYVFKADFGDFLETHKFYKY